MIEWGSKACRVVKSHLLPCTLPSATPQHYDLPTIIKIAKFQCVQLTVLSTVSATMTNNAMHINEAHPDPWRHQSTMNAAIHKWSVGLRKTFLLLQVAHDATTAEIKASCEELTGLRFASQVLCVNGRWLADEWVCAELMTGQWFLPTQVGALMSIKFIPLLSSNVGQWSALVITHKLWAHAVSHCFHLHTLATRASA